MVVKICGSTCLEDAALAVTLGADALGFIFAPSKRRVTVAAAAAMVAALPAGVGKVGVFTEPEPQEISRTVRAVGLTAVQLHTRFDPGLIGRLAEDLGPDVALWQVIAAETEPADPAAAEEELGAALRGPLRERRVAVVLLDAARGGVSGGLGEAFRWARVAPVLRRELAAAGREAEGQGFALPEIVVAGGLHAGNVREAIAALEPWGVDCVSGVEAQPGRKDPERLRAFLVAARRGAQGQVL